MTQGGNTFGCQGGTNIHVVEGVGGVLHDHAWEDCDRGRKGLKLFDLVIKSFHHFDGLNSLTPMAADLPQLISNLP